MAGGLAAGAGDIVKYLVRPTGAFFFGYTLNAILGAALYGVFFYKMRVSVLRAAVCKLVINVCVNGLLGTLWYAMLYGKGFKRHLLAADVYQHRQGAGGDGGAAALTAGADRGGQAGETAHLIFGMEPQGVLEKSERNRV